MPLQRLKNKSLTELKAKVGRALERAGLSFEDLSSSTEEIVLFGSTAAGCDGPGSDVDLLCVGKGDRKDTGLLNLLWIDPLCWRDPDWLSSELGGHVAKYGIWLRGQRTLGPPQKPSQHAIDDKKQRILDRATVLQQKWPLLSSSFKRSSLRNLRLDVQRYEILKAGEPVPPTPILDQRWMAQQKKGAWLIARIGSDRIMRTRLLPMLSSGNDMTLR